MKEQEFMSYWKSNHGHLHRQKPQTVNKSTKSKASPKIISSRHESFGSDGFEFGGEDDSSFLSKHSSNRNSSRMAGGGAASTSSTVSNEVNMVALEALKKEQAARELAAKKALVWDNLGFNEERPIKIQVQTLKDPRVKVRWSQNQQCKYQESNLVS